MSDLDKILEGLLFLSGDGLDRGTIMEKLSITPKQLDKAVEILKERYNENCGINMITYKDKLQLCASPKYADEVSQVLNPIRERQLTKATLEVMAIIAYKQPVTRLDVQDIRGINSDYAIQTLLNYKLIEVVGRKDAIGKPLLFGTTDEFLRHFGINNLDELPDYAELMKDIEKIQLENNHLYNEFEIPDDEKTNSENEENSDNNDNAETKNLNEKVETKKQINAIDADENNDSQKKSADEKDLDIDLETIAESTYQDNKENNVDLDEELTDENVSNFLNTDYQEENKENENGIDYSLIFNNPDIGNE